MSCCAGDAWGVAVGELVGIGIPGVCVCGEAAGDGDAVGICRPGVITFGVDEGFGLFALVAEGRRARLGVLFFLAALFDFGWAAGFILDMSCPSCCGNTFTATVNIKTSALSVRSAVIKLPDRFMLAPCQPHESER